MLVEQDGYYLNAIGEILKIEIKDDGIPTDKNRNKYIVDGTFSYNNKYDLIGYIPKESHYKILKIINDYHSKGNK